MELSKSTADDNHVSVTIANQILLLLFNVLNETSAFITFISAFIIINLFTNI